MVGMVPMVKSLQYGLKEFSNDAEVLGNGPNEFCNLVKSRSFISFSRF
jgi:hypothetical protein